MEPATKSQVLGEGLLVQERDAVVAMDDQGFAVETETDAEEVLFVGEEVAGASTEEDGPSPFAIR